MAELYINGAVIFNLMTLGWLFSGGATLGAVVSAVCALAFGTLHNSIIKKQNEIKVDWVVFFLNL